MNHLVRQSCGYCVRLKVPLELHGLLGRKEIRYGLHTGSLMEAKFKAKMIVRQVKELFQKLKSDGDLKK
jgi:hypothetical protein